MMFNVKELYTKRPTEFSILPSSAKKSLQQVYSCSHSCLAAVEGYEEGTGRDQVCHYGRLYCKFLFFFHCLQDVIFPLLQDVAAALLDSMPA